MFTIRKKLFINLGITILFFVSGAAGAIAAFKHFQHLQRGQIAVEQQVQNWLDLKLKLSQYLKVSLEDILESSLADRERLASSVDDVIHTFIALERQMKFKQEYISADEWAQQKQQLLVIREQFGLINEELETIFGLFIEDLDHNKKLLSSSNLVKNGLEKKFNARVDVARSQERALSDRLENESQKLQENIARLALITFGIVMTVMIFIISRVNHSVQRSISNAKAELLRGTEAVGAGNFESGIQFATRDELSVVADAFNKMSSALREARELLDQQQQNLVNSAKMSSLGEMAGGIAHEINTPLATICLLVSHLEDGIKNGDLNPAEMGEMLSIIKQTTDRIAKIVSGLRLFARDGRKDPVQMTNVEKLIDDTLSLCQERFSSHGTKLELPRSPTYSEISFECRPVEISQVLLNLLNNAHDAVRDSEQKWIRIDVQEKDDKVEISVADSGPGIPAEIRSKIMQPFFTTKDLGKGTGLGLSISKGIIESHDGILSLAGTSSTQFILTVPKRQPLRA